MSVSRTSPPGSRSLSGILDRFPHQAGWIACWLAAVIVIPVLGVGLIRAWPTLVEISLVASSNGFRRTSAFAAFCAFASAVWLARRRAPLSPVAFVLFTSLFGGYLRFFYILAVQPEWTSDFLSYWGIALQQVAEGNFTATDLYTERTLPVLVPLIMLAGGEKTVVALANICMLGMVQLAGYDILRRHASHQAAQAFTVAFLMAPIPYFASTIPSHDLWAMWLLALVLWVSSLALGGAGRRLWIRAGLGGLVLALLCLVMEIQRGVGTILAASLAISALIAWLASRKMADASSGRHSGAVALMCLAVLAAQFPLGALASHIQLRAAQSPAHEAYLTGYYASNGTSFGNGTWGWMRQFRSNFTDHMESTEVERLESFATSVMLSDWAAQPDNRVHNAVVRMGGLFEFDNSNFWYFTGTPPSLDRPLRFLLAYSGFFSLGFAGLLLLALGRTLLGGHPSYPVLTGLVLTSVSALALSTFSENQPRYIMWLWFVGLLYIAEVFSRRAMPMPVAFRSGAVLVSAILLGWLGLLLVLWMPVKLLYGHDDGRILTEWTYPAIDQPSGDLPPTPPEHYAVITGSPGALALTLQTDGRHVAETHLCVPEDGPRALAFHAIPYGQVPGDTLQVSYGPNTYRSDPLPAAGSPAQEIRVTGILPAGTCDSLRFQIESAQGEASSRVDLYFPRLE